MSFQKVKISGDGANISRVSNYIVMSFALLSDEKEVMSTKGKLCGKLLSNFNHK